VELDVDAVVVLGISVAAAFYYSFRFLRHCRLIEDMPTSKVRSAPQGYVELEGTARLMENTDIISPLTRTACAWWFYEIEKRVRSGKNESWDTIDKKTSETPFYLEDVTGRCVVNPVGAEVVTIHKRIWQGGTAWPAGPPTGSRFFNSGNYRYTERLIPREAQVYALGLFATQGVVADAAAEQAALRALLAGWKKDKARMQLLDVNRDGNIDVKEWEAARRVALKELRAANREIQTQGLHSLSRAPLDNQPFILSEVLQKDLCKRWRWYAGLCFAWFLMGGAIFVWQLIVYGILGP